MSRLGAHDKMARTKTNIPNNTKTRKTLTQQTLRKNYCFFFRFFYNFLNDFSKKEMLSYRLGTVNDFYCGLKPVFRYSKYHT